MSVADHSGRGLPHSTTLARGLEAILHPRFDPPFASCLKIMIARYLPRAGQRAFARDLERHRVCAFLTRRQYGKTTNAARIALQKMMQQPGHTVIFGSVKLDLGREIVRKESEAMGRLYHELAATARADQLKLTLVDARSGLALRPPGDNRRLSASGFTQRREQLIIDYLKQNAGAQHPQAITADDLAELYEAQRLEFRLHFSKLLYSRTKVVALTPAAVGETGDLITDEVGRAKNFREICEAVKPIIGSNPDFRWLLTTTPPPDDSHYSFDLLAPPAGWDPPPCAAGNTYTSESGIFVRRITAYDAELDGVHLYDDDTGAIITPAESRRREADKDAWDRNYAVKFVLGGTAAVPLLVLENAQQRGRTAQPCEFFPIETETDLARALDWLRARLTDGPVGLGWDLATTERQTSNPSAFAVVEQLGEEFAARAVFTWKTADPARALERVRQILHTINARPAGGRARRLCLDATNERYFSSDVRRALRGEVPVELVVASESVERPGQPNITVKQQLGERLVAALEDNRIALPGARYLHEDFRLVKKERGQFVCEPDGQGRHGDTFDAVKLALKALASGANRTVVLGGQPPQNNF